MTKSILLRLECMSIYAKNFQKVKIGSSNYFNWEYRNCGGKLRMLIFWYSCCTIHCFMFNGTLGAFFGH